MTLLQAQPIPGLEQLLDLGRRAYPLGLQNLASTHAPEIWSGKLSFRPRFLGPDFFKSSAPKNPHFSVGAVRVDQL